MLRGQWCNQYLQRSSPIIKVVVCPPRILIIQAFFPTRFPNNPWSYEACTSPPAPSPACPDPICRGTSCHTQPLCRWNFLRYCMIEIILKQASWQLWPLLACSTAWPSGEKWLKSTWQSTCILSQSTFPSWAPSLERFLVPSEELITSNSQQLH